MTEIAKQKLKLKEMERSLGNMETCHRVQVEKEEEVLVAAKEELKDFKRSQKQIPRPDFDCPVCLEMMAPPRKIFECERGHLLCEDCMKRPEIRTCPTCRGLLRGRNRRNLAMERLIEDYYTKMSS